MVSCGWKGVKLKLATCTVIKISLGQLLVPSLHTTSMALTYFTPWTDQASQLRLHCVIRVSMIALGQIQCLCSMQSRNLWDCAAHSETARQSGDCEIFCAISRLCDHNLQSFDQTMPLPMWEVFQVLFGIRGVTRILRLHRIVGKSVQCPCSRPVGIYFRFIQRQELEQCRCCWRI